MGTTTFASYFAEEFKRQSGQPVLLVDLDPSGASAAFLLRAQGEHSALEAASNLHRLDADFWKSVVWTAPSGVDLLQAPGTLHFRDRLDGERARHVLRFVRGLYDWVVVDLGRLDALSMPLIEETQQLFLVTTPELPSLYESRRILQRLHELGRAEGELRLVLNRMSGDTAFTPKDLAKALGYPVYASFNDWTSDLHDAIGSGQFVTGCPSLRKQVGEVTARILGKEPTEPRKAKLKFLRLAKNVPAVRSA